MSSARFSYAATISHPRWQRVARVIERASGQRRLERLYSRYHAGPRSADFFDDALSLLGVAVLHDPARLQALPASGPLVFVANHPFGVIDGMALAWLAGRVRDNVRIIAHSALAQIPETVPSLFSIDFSGTREAERGNVAVRAAALRHLKEGGTLVVFPAGCVATAPTPFARRAEDAPWGPLTARLVQASGAHVVPVHFEGQNSRLFQVASHISETVRLALLFRESVRRIGGAITARIGAPIPPEMLAGFSDRADLMGFLRERTMALAPALPARRKLRLPPVRPPGYGLRTPGSRRLRA